MKKHHRSKAKNQTYHFKKRCNERLGMQIDRKALQRRIREQKLDEKLYVLNKQFNRVTRYRYKFQDKWYIIPYDKNTHKVITIFEDKIQDVTIQSSAADIPQYISNNHDKPKNWLKIFIQLLKSYIILVKKFIISVRRYFRFERYLNKY